VGAARASSIERKRGAESATATRVPAVDAGDGVASDTPADSRPPTTPPATSTAAAAAWNQPPNRCRRRDPKPFPESMTPSAIKAGLNHSQLVTRAPILQPPAAPGA